LLAEPGLRKNFVFLFIPVKKSDFLFVCDARKREWPVYHFFLIELVLPL